MQKNNKRERVISETGTILFDGNMTLKIQGKEYRVRFDYLWGNLKRASQNHEIIMIIRHHLDYNEIDTGFLVRTKEYDKEGEFGLKPRKSDRSWSVFKYTDVVAWGYADGGLGKHNTHYCACQMRPEDYPQFVEDVEDIKDEYFDDETTGRRGVKFRIDNEEVYYSACATDDEPMVENATKLMRDAADNFFKFRKQHPEVTEVHYYTDEEVDLTK